MAGTRLFAKEVESAGRLLDEYLDAGSYDQASLDGDTRFGRERQNRFKYVLKNPEALTDPDFRLFLRDEVWAIHGMLRKGLLDAILTQNSVQEIRSTLRDMLADALGNPDRDAVLASHRRPSVGVSILSEVLCKVYPAKYSIKNKKSELALAEILDVSDPDHIAKKMSYSDFIDRSWAVWGLQESAYRARSLKYRFDMPLWYVDRFYLWIYEEHVRPRLGDSD